MRIRLATIALVMVVGLTAALPACLNFHFSHSRTGLWFYSYSSSSAVSGVDSLISAGTPAAGLSPASWLAMRPGGNYTMDFGRFEYGTWAMKDTQLYLTNQFHRTTMYPMHYNTSEDIQLIIEKGILAHFENHALPDTAKEADPFSVQRNRWRMPAGEKESDNEIRHRLLNHFQFWEAYFTWALNDHISSVDVRSTPTLLKIYGNGFVLKPFSDLPARWISIFYDTEECRRANDMMEKLFQTRTIAWAHTDNKYKLFIGAFQQMEEWLR